MVREEKRPALQPWVPKRKKTPLPAAGAERHFGISGAKRLHSLDKRHERHKQRLWLNIDRGEGSHNQASHISTTSPLGQSPARIPKIPSTGCIIQMGHLPPPRPPSPAVRRGSRRTERGAKQRWRSRAALPKEACAAKTCNSTARPRPSFLVGFGSCGVFLCVCVFVCMFLGVVFAPFLRGNFTRKKKKLGCWTHGRWGLSGDQGEPHNCFP